MSLAGQCVYVVGSMEGDLAEWLDRSREMDTNRVCASENSPGSDLSSPISCMPLGMLLKFSVLYSLHLCD